MTSKDNEKMEGGVEVAPVWVNSPHHPLYWTRVAIASVMIAVTGYAMTMLGLVVLPFGDVAGESTARFFAEMGAILIVLGIITSMLLLCGLVAIRGTRDVKVRKWLKVKRNS